MKIHSKNGSFPERRARGSGVRWSLALGASVADMLKMRSGAGGRGPLPSAPSAPETDAVVRVLLPHLRSLRVCQQWPKYARLCPERQRRGARAKASLPLIYLRFTSDGLDQGLQCALYMSVRTGSSLSTPRLPYGQETRTRQSEYRFVSRSEA
ncbi:hypothetical protein AMELA_G00213330 [Ameiurus melas]|uniref:Uncharacterized protein n=1 Tax=Ameiurus melas TaxID=219545 RepID=A0A7J6A0F5_AMEME|nr:hypothetical protein AMELA_G00213330 [Ameiurus melas]